MIDKESFHPLNYIKKEEYSGSMDGMRYMLKKVSVTEEDADAEDGVKKVDKLEVTIWPEPFNYHSTTDDKKEKILLPLTAEGVSEAADWLNDRYVARKEYWLEAKRTPWI